MSRLPEAPLHRATGQSNKRLCFFTILLLVIATVSWRRGVYYSGGFDPVVAGKGAVSLIALTMAWFARQASPVLVQVRGRSLLFLSSYLTISVVGAYAAGQLVPSAILAARIFILALALYYLARVFPREVLFSHLISAMLLVASISTITGLVSSGVRDRLFGGVPPLHPNEIAVLFAVSLIGLVWLALQDLMRGHHLLLLLLAVGAIWLTGSRTGLAAAIVAMAFMLLMARRLNRVVAVVVAATIPAGFYFIFSSEVLDGYFMRGGSEQLTTLSSRTIAWSAARSFPETFWAQWTGTGLSQKLIPVSDQWWDEQILDSTWVSALVQAGQLGFLVLLLWLAVVAIASLRSQRAARIFLVGALTLLVIRSVLESGLFDSTPAFLVFMLISLTCDDPEQVRSRPVVETGSEVVVTTYPPRP